MGFLDDIIVTNLVGEIGLELTSQVGLTDGLVN